MSGSYSTAGQYGTGAYTNPMNDLERRMDNVDIGQGRRTSGGDYSNRRRSTYTEAPIAGQPPTSPYQGPIAPPSPITTAANPGYAPAAGYGTSPYPPVGPAQDPYQRAASPYHGHPGAPEQAILSRSRAPSPNPMSGNPMTGVGAYGSRSRAPSPIPGAFGGPRSRAPSPNPNPPPYAPQRPRSRAASPLPGTMPGQYGAQQPGYPQPSYPGAIPRSPHVGGGVLAGPEQQAPMLLPPDGFSRPANLAQSYTFFETMKIQDMDDFYDNIPRMPMVLVPHDVYHEDWIRLCQVGFFLGAPFSLVPVLIFSRCRTSRCRGAGSSPRPTQAALHGRRSSPPSSSISGTTRFSHRVAWRSSSSRATSDAPDKGSAKSNATSLGLATQTTLTLVALPPPIRPTSLTTSMGAVVVVVVAVVAAIMGRMAIRRGRRRSAKQRRSASTKRRRPVVVLVSAKEHTPSTSPASPRVTGPFLPHISQSS
jgi:hypothetical protein